MIQEPDLTNWELSDTDKATMAEIKEAMDAAYRQVSDTRAILKDALYGAWILETGLQPEAIIVQTDHNGTEFTYINRGTAPASQEMLELAHINGDRFSEYCPWKPSEATLKTEDGVSDEQGNPVWRASFVPIQEALRTHKV
jgi:hypothetical protein